MKKKKLNPQKLNNETYELIKKVKKVVLSSIYNDDELAQYLTLKGGTLLDMVWEVTGRPSVDIDFSIDTTLSDALDNPDEFGDRFKKALEQGFSEGIDGVQYSVLDFKLELRPPEISDDLKHFWGGYMASFSIIETSKQTTPEEDKKRALFIGKSKVRNGETLLSPKFSIDISLHEICGENRKEAEFGDVFIEIYTPLMVVYEKLRAICQTDPRYNSIIKRSRDSKPRTKDFYDIYMIMTSLDIDIKENLSLLQEIFSIKRVPLKFLEGVKDKEDFHSGNFETVLSTLPEDEVEHKTFKPYFDFVIDLIEKEILPNIEDTE